MLINKNSAKKTFSTLGNLNQGLSTLTNIQNSSTGGQRIQEIAKIIALLANF